MAIIESVSRFVGTLIAIVHTRVELATVELEEESLRLFSYLISVLVVLFCGGMAVLLAVLLVVVLYWDSYRVVVLLSLVGFFSVMAILIGLGVRYCYRRKPKLLFHSLSELSKDIERLKSPSNDSE